MAYRLLLDENLEHEVLDRLDGRHDVEHVDLAPELGKGSNDEALARYSVETDRAIVTYDDDFIGDVPPDQYRAVLFFEADTLPAADVAAIIDAMSDVYPYEQVEGLQKVGREWL
ncbi:hypothetical protein BRC95_07600 [Halobacteriales archaeon QS_5_68_33]|nr:MAG: hypothetical protein BRC95_07600 [Halobacteriales archaeon QS_5_68_33]